MKEFLERLENGSISSSLNSSMSKENLYDVIYDLDEIIDSWLSSNQYNDITDELIKRLK